jgi:hypothetical protein
VEASEAPPPLSGKRRALRREAAAAQGHVGAACDGCVLECHPDRGITATGVRMMPASDYADLPLPRHNWRRPRPLGHPTPSIEPGDAVVVADGREAIVTARLEAEPGWRQLVALLEVAIARSLLEADDALP